MKLVPYRRFTFTSSNSMKVILMILAEQIGPKRYFSKGAKYGGSVYSTGHFTMHRHVGLLYDKSMILASGIVTENEDGTCTITATVGITPLIYIFTCAAIAMLIIQDFCILSLLTGIALFLVVHLIIMLNYIYVFKGMRSSIMSINNVTEIRNDTTTIQ